MRIAPLSVFMPLVCTLALCGFSSAAYAGYKDQGQPCGAQCDHVEQRVDIQVIHKPRPAMLHIPNTGPRKRVRVYYHHSYQQRQAPNVQIIDRSTPLSQEHHQRVEMETILPEARPLSALRTGLARGASRLLGRR